MREDTNRAPSEGAGGATAWRERDRDALAAREVERVGTRPRDVDDAADAWLRDVERLGARLRVLILAKKI